MEAGPQKSKKREQRRGLSQEYLQISPNILATFPKGAPPVSLYMVREDLDRMAPMHEAEKRLTKKSRLEVVRQCKEGNLFINRTDFSLFSKHLSHNLAVLLAEHTLDEAEAAKIFFDGLKFRLIDFFRNPIQSVLADLMSDIAIFCEYLWIDPARTMVFLDALNRRHSLGNHSVSVAFMAMALYIAHLGAKTEKAVLNNVVLGFLLHDMGMSKIPPNITTKPGTLLFKERTKVQEHIDLGNKMMQRLEMGVDEVRICINQHHERMDGTGYPHRLRGHDIHVLGRICAAADSFCSMISERPHAKALNPLIAALTLVEEKKKYDPNITKLLLSFILKGNKKVREMFRDPEKLGQLKGMAQKHREAYASKKA